MEETEYNKLGKDWSTCDTLQESITGLKNELDDLTRCKHPRVPELILKFTKLVEQMELFDDELELIKDDISQRMSEIEDAEFEEETKRQVAEYAKEQLKEDE